MYGKPYYSTTRCAVSFFDAMAMAHYPFLRLSENPRCPRCHDGAMAMAMAIMAIYFLPSPSPPPTPHFVPPTTMHSFLALLFGALCCFSTWCVSTVEAAEVHVLTDSTFEHQTQASTGQTTGKWLVKFYAPWCEYSY